MNKERSIQNEVDIASNTSQKEKEKVYDQSQGGNIGANELRTDSTSCHTMNDNNKAYCLFYEYYTLGAPVEIHPEYMDNFYRTE